jgi:beta-lactamase superfamily II metal-dependent hydrolase
MLNRKLTYSILISLTAIAAILAVIIFFNRKNNLEVVFLNVGQGDAILISEGSNQILIDGGRDGKLLLEKLGKHVPFWDRDIEIIVATHPDQDHIGGLIDVLKSYRVYSVLKTNAQSDSETYKKLEEKIIAENAQKVEAKKNVTVKLSDGTTAEVLFPLNSLPEAVDEVSNDNSAVIKLTYGENKFIFTGDLPSTQEEYLIRDSLASGNSLNSQVLKVSHHGSKYATSDEFLEAVKPAEAVISVGKNSYGHPNQEVLNRLLQHGIKIIRTDEMGDVVYKCAGLENKCKLQSL